MITCEKCDEERVCGLVLYDEYEALGPDYAGIELCKECGIKFVEWLDD